MNAQGFAADFAQFLREGRIGSPAPELHIALDSSAVATPLSVVQGSLRASNAGLSHVSWRMRGQPAWVRASVVHDRFTLQSPAQAGTMELRAVGEGEGEDHEEVIAWAFVELAWPAAEVRVEATPPQVRRHEHWAARIHARWVEKLTVTREDGNVSQHVFGPGEDAALDIAGNIVALGSHRIELAWLSRDGSEGRQTLTYEVLARPMKFTIQPHRSGGLIYATECADTIELHLEGGFTPIPLPEQGIIENTFLAALTGQIRYRDEAGQWQNEPIRLDYAPRAWPIQRGFQ